ncbi:hypothetical protein BW156_09760 [Lactococcus cremoris]|uniref:hypothetical protein n=2 Tax=Lactococcus lactis subsp. cremoris TaxID=1359 RepID=UPI000BFA1CA1|nr:MULTISPECIES: hypothetical protein [Lactococcus]PFG91479.1 hypothetical protein BW156_09760 [Lactococcus cremoris]
MLENTQKIYQLILETEKKFNDEKAKLVKRRETLQKKIDSKLPFSSAAKKREARYEVEEIDISIDELERDKKQAVLDLEVLPQLKKAHDEDSKTWESSNNKKIDELLDELDSKIIPLMKAAEKETKEYTSLEMSLSKKLEEKLTENEVEFKNSDLAILPLYSYKRPHGEGHVSEKLKNTLRAINNEFDLMCIMKRAEMEYNIRNQSTEEERQKEIEEKGGYHINEGNFVIVDNAKYIEWCNKEYGDKSKKK